uniref:(Dimethylallyl)adenosine tRNA methylthiotransferase MiaB n=1 Tax=Anthurium amnicola TaxID=1678845 RepID=A0A1D1XWP8_9ARAE
MDTNGFTYEDEVDAAVVGALSACVGVLELLVNYNDGDEHEEYVPRIPSSDRDRIRKKYMESIIGVDDVTSIKMICVNRRTFYQLYTVVRQKKLLHDTLHVTVQEQLLMFLHTISHNVRNSVMSIHYRRSGETVSRYFNHVLVALRQLHNDYIRPPDDSIPDEIRSKDIYWPWFKDCIGTIDGTHVLASVPSDIVARFRGKADKPTQNVLAAVRFDLSFSYVLAGWEGSAHDVTVLKDALQRPNGLKFITAIYIYIAVMNL